MTAPPSDSAPDSSAPLPQSASRGPRRFGTQKLGPLQRPELKTVLRWGLPIVVTSLVGVGVGIGVAAAINMPRVETLYDFSPARITRLIDADGDAYASYFRQRRVVVREDEVPEIVRHALVSLEDANFYKHGGFDVRGVARAALSNLTSGFGSEGASTLTMQLARKLFLSPEKRWRRKIEETFLAVELEKNLSKDQILTLYLNIHYFGHGQYGIAAASKYFFGKTLDQLTLAEAATLAGIPWRPSELSPYDAPEAVVRRRNKCLGRMLAEGYITAEEHALAVAEPLEVVTHEDEKEIGRYFSEEVRRHLERTHGTTTLLERGLTVQTTLDPAIQKSAETGLRDGLLEFDHRKGWRGAHATVEDPETAVLDSWNDHAPQPGRWFEAVVLESNRSRAQVRIGDFRYTLTPDGAAWTRRRPDRLLKRGDVAWFRLEEPTQDAPEDAEPLLMLEQQPELQGAAVVLESATGAVRAMVGGWDFSRNQFNRVTQARRQPGSAIKLFVYGAALEAGFTAADTVFDGPVWFTGSDNLPSYSPKNYYGDRYYGIVTLRRALEGSYNIAAVKLLDLIGVESIIDFAQRSGIASDLPPYPSLALGAADLSPLELAAAYAAIANQGTYVAPYLIERVTTPEGRVLEERIAETRTATTPEVAYVLTHMMEGVVDRGTARSIRDLDIDIAGKTGTTNDYTDAWFAGFTPRYTMLVWVGYDQKRSMGQGMAGDKVALPIWRRIAEDGLETGWLETGQRFVPPATATMVEIEYLSGYLAAPGAERVLEEAFVAGTEPVRPFTEDWGEIMALPWYLQSPFYLPKEGERMPEDFIGLEEELAAAAAAATAGGG